jgi:hypothetical protein
MDSNMFPGAQRPVGEQSGLVIPENHIHFPRCVRESHSSEQAFAPAFAIVRARGGDASDFRLKEPDCPWLKVTDGKLVALLGGFIPRQGGKPLHGSLVEKRLLHGVTSASPRLMLPGAKM